MGVAADEPDLACHPVESVVGDMSFDELKVVGEHRQSLVPSSDSMKKPIASM